MCIKSNYLTTLLCSKCQFQFFPSPFFLLSLKWANWTELKIRCKLHKGRNGGFPHHLASPSSLIVMSTAFSPTAIATLHVFKPTRNADYFAHVQYGTVRNRLRTCTKDSYRTGRTPTPFGGSFFPIWGLK